MHQILLSNRFSLRLTLLTSLINRHDDTCRQCQYVSSVSGFFDSTDTRNGISVHKVQRWINWLFIPQFSELVLNRPQPNDHWFIFHLPYQHTILLQCKNMGDIPLQQPAIICFVPHGLGHCQYEREISMILYTGDFCLSAFVIWDI